MRRRTIWLLPLLLLSGHCARPAAVPEPFPDTVGDNVAENAVATIDDGDPSPNPEPPNPRPPIGPPRDRPTGGGQTANGGGDAIVTTSRPRRPGAARAEVARATASGGETASPAAAEPCEAIRGRVASATDCREYGRQRAALRDGLAAFRPPEMTVGTPTTMTLAVGAAEQAKAVVESLGGDAATVKRIEIRIGDSLAAELAGSPDLFKIAPTGRVVKPMPDNHRQSWAWDVTPLVAGAHNLTLTIGVPAIGASGAADFYLESKVYPVKVVARPPTPIGVLDAVAKFLTSLRGLLIALAAVIAAAGGVWLGLRNFGKKAPEKPAEAPAKP